MEVSCCFATLLLSHTLNPHPHHLVARVCASACFFFLFHILHPTPSVRKDFPPPLSSFFVSLLPVYSLHSLLCEKMRLLSRALSAVASPVASQTLRAGIASAVRVPGTARQALSTPTFRAASTVPTTKPEFRLTGPCLVATRRHLSSTTSRNYSSSSSSENDSDSDGAFVTAMDEDDFSSPASNARDSLPTSGCNLKHQLLSWQEQRHRLRHGSAQHIVSMQPVPSTFSAIIAG